MGWMDLHLHSLYSTDGDYSPEELMSLCAQSGVNVAAIADHNSVGGVKTAQISAAQSGITLIPGIELDCDFQGVGLHLLGYWIDPEYPDFSRVEKDVLSQELAASKERLRLARRLGLFVSPFQAYRLSHGGVVTAEIIAEVALAEPENEGNPLLAPYRPGGARHDNAYVNFYWDFYAQGKPAYVPVRFISLSEAVELIRAAGGIAVLAHPGNNVHEDLELLRSIIKQGVSGLEAYSSYHSPAQVSFYRKQAAVYGLAMSCGSDFHGKTKPMISIGSVDCAGMEADLLSQLQRKWEDRK